jgi:hypothetical protein
MAHIEDIIASKLHIIADGGRKKDFWDISELLEHYKLSNLLDFVMEKYPWMNQVDVLKGLTDFSRADEMEDPICLKGKIWELIKLDIKEIVEGFKNSKYET